MILVYVQIVIWTSFQNNIYCPWSLLVYLFEKLLVDIAGIFMICLGLIVWALHIPMSNEIVTHEGKVNLWPWEIVMVGAWWVYECGVQTAVPSSHAGFLSSLPSTKSVWRKCSQQGWLTASGTTRNTCKLTLLPHRLLTPQSTCLIPPPVHPPAYLISYH